jgi:hypothetical protein
VVPLSSFNTDLQGFRCTLLEQNELKFRKTMETLATSVKEYLESAHTTEAQRKRAESPVADPEALEGGEVEGLIVNSSKLKGESRKPND